MVAIHERGGRWQRAQRFREALERPLFTERFSTKTVPRNPCASSAQSAAACCDVSFARITSSYRRADNAVARLVKLRACTCGRRLTTETSQPSDSSTRAWRDPIEP